MTNECKQQLLDSYFMLLSIGVRVSIDYSVHGLVTMSVWSDDEYGGIDFFSIINEGDCIERKTQEILGYVMARDIKKSKYEVA